MGLPLGQTRPHSYLWWGPLVNANPCRWYRPYSYSSFAGELPSPLYFHCCAQFIVHRDTIRRHPREKWLALFHALLTTGLFDSLALILPSSLGYCWNLHTLFQKMTPVDQAIPSVILGEGFWSTCGSTSLEWLNTWEACIGTFGEEATLCLREQCNQRSMSLVDQRDWSLYLLLQGDSTSNNSIVNISVHNYLMFFFWLA